MSDPRTIIFDFDGTLVESLWAGFKVYNEVAPEFGFRTIDESEIDKCRDMSTRELIRFAGVPLYKLPMVIKRLRADMRKEIPSIKIAPGIEACIKQLHGSGHRLGIVTSNGNENVELCLSNNHIFSHFDFLHTSINLFGKHRTLNWVIRRKGVDRQRAIYVGDENRDIDAARKCNIPSIAVGWGFQSKQKLLGAEPNFFASNPIDIVKYVNEPE